MRAMPLGVSSARFSAFFREMDKRDTAELLMKYTKVKEYEQTMGRW